MCIFGEMKNFSQWSDVEKHLSTADNQTKGELFEQITENFLKWSPKCVHESMPLLCLLNSSSFANFLNFSAGNS